MENRCFPDNVEYQEVLFSTTLLWIRWADNEPAAYQHCFGYVSMQYTSEQVFLMMAI